jgi:hypothetical protein
LPTKTRLFWALLGGALLLARGVQADTEPIRIEYRAGEGCPNADEFNAEVFQRTASARLAAEGEDGRTFSIVIERSGFGVTGSLVIRETDGATVARKVTGKDCTDVATVLALATALAIDPRAELDVDVAPEPAPEPPKPVVVPPPAAPPVEPETTDYESPPLPPRGPRSWNAAVGPAFAFGIAPRAAIGGLLLVEYGNRARGAALSSVGGELLYLEAPQAEVAGASAKFRFFLLRPRACLFALGPPGPVWLAPCLGVELGAVTGEGSDLPNRSSSSRFWGSVDGLLRLGVGLGDAFFLEVEGGAGLPLTRYQFVFENPSTPVYDVPAVVGLVSARLGVRL